MIVSHNELVSAVNKAFLGTRRLCGEADVIANMVADLQMAGLHGVRHFNNASRFLGLDSDCAASISQRSDETLEVNLHHSSVACHLPAVLDFALEKMVQSKSVTVELKQCHNRWLAYSELLKLAAKGIACRANWSNGTNPKNVLYVLNRGQVAPELYFSEESCGSIESEHSMTIELAVSDFDVSAISQGYNAYVDAKELVDAQQSSWREGIFVEDEEWELLKQTATVFLVENSERSRQGAGELV